MRVGTPNNRNYLFAETYFVFAILMFIINTSFLLCDGLEERSKWLFGTFAAVGRHYFNKTTKH